MKCPHCGFDRILPMYKVCPNCKQPLNASDKEEKNTEEQSSDEPQSKLIGLLLMSYKKAVSDPEGFGAFVKKHPNDARRLWNKWTNEGRDLSMLAKYNPTDEAKPTTTSEAPVVQINAPVASAQSSVKPSQTEQVAPSAPTAQAKPSAAAQSVSNNSTSTIENIAATASATTTVSKVVEMKNDVGVVRSSNKERHYVNWSIAPGQIARNISAQAFEELDNVDGVYVQEGVTAVVFVDGENVAELHGGLYKFATEKIQREATEKHADEQAKESLFSKIGRAGRSLWALLTGSKDKFDRAEASKKREQVKKIAQRLTRNSIVAVVLKRDGAVQLALGIQPIPQQDGSSQIAFAPYKIRTKTLTVDVAVSLEVRVTDFYQFRTNYLMDKMSYSVNDVRLALNTVVRTMVQRQMQDYIADGNMLPQELLSTISYEIISNSRNLLHGMEVVQVLDITQENEAFERFRTIEEKFYCTEKEIDYLVRTNEFKNRLQSEENAQKLREAKTELELRKELDKINNDQLVHEDEMEAFVQLLQSQKRIREARAENEELAIMLELKGNRLVSEDEFDAIVTDIQDKHFDRHQVSEAFQLASANRTAETRLELETKLTKSKLLAEAELHDVRFEILRKQTEQDFDLEDFKDAHGREKEKQETTHRHEQEKQEAAHRREQETAEAAHSSDMLDAKLSEAERVDTYSDTRRDKDYDFEQRQKEDEYRRTHRDTQDEIDFGKQRTDNKFEDDSRRAQLEVDLEKQRTQTAMDALAQKAELARRNMEAMQAHEERLAEKTHQEKLAEIAAKAGMTPEQLMASGLAGLDAEAQKKFAESFAGKNNAEIQKEMYERLLQMQQQHSSDSAAQNAAQLQQMQQMMQQMMQFAQTGMQTNATMAKDLAAGQAAQNQSYVNAMQNIAGARVQQTEQLKEEYRTQMHHEQGRTDNAQDKALNYTTRVAQEDIKASAKMAASAPTESTETYYLPDFGKNYTRQEIENYIMQGILKPDTEIEKNKVSVPLYDLQEFLPFVLNKYGKTCPQCGKTFLEGFMCECGYEE